mgnify:CR=1 FL=1
MKKYNHIWFNRLATSKETLREKMTLFWANHFVAKDARIKNVEQYNNLLRKHALGDFRQFVKAVSREPVMIQFLNLNLVAVKRGIFVCCQTCRFIDFGGTVFVTTINFFSCLILSINIDFVLFCGILKKDTPVPHNWRTTMTHREFFEKARDICNHYLEEITEGLRDL